jgi:hypothetical protein
LAASFTGVGAALPGGRFAACACDEALDTRPRRAGAEPASESSWHQLRRGPAKEAKLTLWLQWQPVHGGWLNLGLPAIGVRTSLKPLVKASRCTPGTYRTLRGKMDVDIIGYPDSSNKNYSNVREDVKCGR